VEYTTNDIGGSVTKGLVHWTCD